MKNFLSVLFSLLAVAAAVAGILYAIKRVMESRCCIEKSYDMYGNEVLDHHNSCTCCCDDDVPEEDAE